MSAVLSSARLPERHESIGPITARRLRRTGFAYLVLCAAGFALALAASAPGLQAFGLGLAFPGGGFLHFLAGGPWSVLLHLGCALLTVLLFVVALLLWFGTGNQAAPVVVWLGAALTAGAMGHVQTLPGSPLIVALLAAGTVAGGWRIHRRMLARKRARRDARNAVLGQWQPSATVVLADGVMPQVDELSPDDLAALRYALDRALQPVERFAGFDFIDQFQPSAIRYQINNLGYVLSLANYVHLPALRGYLKLAQENLIEKKKQHVVWKYWALESLWGNFRHEPDPIARDNVMYSGWYAAQIGLYALATGDRRYDAPGALTLQRASGERYVHDHPSLVRTLVENVRNSEFCLFPCEPNWIYPLCNNQAALGIRTCDRLHGTQHWADLEALYRRRLEEEFIDVDGHFVLLRSTRTGFTIPGLSSSKEDAIFAFWMHPLFPDLALRAWEIARDELFRHGPYGLELIPLKPWLDAGNYRFNTAYALGALGMAARELGDGDALAAVLAAMAELRTNREGGVLSYPGCSTWSHAFMLKTRVGRTNGLADLVNKGPTPQWLDGPVIADLAYPDVLPARAVSDGSALEAVLYPGRAAGRYELGIAQLHPGARYRLEGCVADSGVADPAGHLRIAVELQGRTPLRIVPST